MIARTIACLLALAIAAGTYADGPDPEPPGNPLARLQGVWKARALLVKGMEKASEASYTFFEDKVTYSPGTGKSARQEMKLGSDKSRKDLIEMKFERIGGGGSRSVRYFFEIKKGELYLAPVRIGDTNPKPDFSGDTSPVLILAREKKKAKK